MCGSTARWRASDRTDHRQSGRSRTSAAGGVIVTARRSMALRAGARRARAGDASGDRGAALLPARHRALPRSGRPARGAVPAGVDPLLARPDAVPRACSSGLMIAGGIGAVLAILGWRERGTFLVAWTSLLVLDGCWASRGKIQHNDLPLLLVAAVLAARAGGRAVDRRAAGRGVGLAGAHEHRRRHRHLLPHGVPEGRRQRTGMGAERQPAQRDVRRRPHRQGAHRRGVALHRRPPRGVARRRPRSRSSSSSAPSSRSSGPARGSPTSSPSPCCTSASTSPTGSTTRCGSAPRRSCSSTGDPRSCAASVGDVEHSQVEHRRLERAEHEQVGVAQRREAGAGGASSAFVQREPRPPRRHREPFAMVAERDVTLEQQVGPPPHIPFGVEGRASVALDEVTATAERDERRRDRTVAPPRSQR